ncbi:molybdate ABC transporter substrate-binding protein [Alloacidobacterium dinghuense]|uniref:Molybdate ABC transporter substrate-binding protein n=2 Tax=Alloacidobacterium dinghuense TaxID=2763107 RepID=A0A7G8BQU6_9BACT|nr:molybdate ABC transporter substrate-binding protein [Alloacidobacterium dinghuense]
MAQSLRLAAAADLQSVLPPILAQLERQTHIHVDASYQSSATLATQIQNGAPFDLFMAADMSFPQRIISEGLADADKAVPYARGTLVLWVRDDSPFRQLSVHTLSDPALKTLAIANAEHAPYGRAAEASLKSLCLYDQLKPKFVIAENIAQTAQYVDSGNAQAGLISLTSALTERLRANGHYIAMPRDSYPPILQGAVVLKNSSNRTQAHQLLEFLLSSPIQKELAVYGLEPANTPETGH